MQLLCEGYEILFDLLTESLYLVLAVAVAVHPVISQLQVVFIAHCPCLRGTVFHQFVVDAVQLFLIFQEKGTHLLPRLSADIAVRIHQIGPQQGQIQLPAVEIDLRTGDELVILHGQRVLLLHQRDQCLTHGLLCQLHILERDRTDLLLQIRSVGGFI